MKIKEKAPLVTTPTTKQYNTNPNSAGSNLPPYDPVKLKNSIVESALTGDISYKNAATLMKSCKLREV